MNMTHHWTIESAKQELDRLIGLCDELGRGHRSSAEHRRWWANVVSLLDDVFGQDSLYYNKLTSFSWSAGSCILDPDDYGRRASLNEMIEDKNQQAFLQQMNLSKGWLQGARDELVRKGIQAVYHGKNTGPEASDIVRIIKLVETRLRPAVKNTPSDEREIKDTFEHLLIGAEIPYKREKESFAYSTKAYTPDFTFQRLDLAIDFKFCNRKDRVNEIIQEVNDYSVAFRTKWGNAFFVVYDCGGFIADVAAFIAPFEERSGVVVRVVKH